MSAAVGRGPSPDDVPVPKDRPASQVDRRTVLQLLGAAPVAAALVWTDAEAVAAQQRAQQAQRKPAPIYLIVGDDETEMSGLAADFSSLVEEDLRAFNVERMYAMADVYVGLCESRMARLAMFDGSS